MTGLKTKKKYVLFLVTTKNKTGFLHCGLGLGLAGLVLCCETRSCYARRHNDLEGHSNFASTVLYSFYNSQSVNHDFRVPAAAGKAKAGMTHSDCG